MPKVVKLPVNHEPKLKPCGGLYYRCGHKQTYSHTRGDYTITTKFKKLKTKSCKGCPTCEEFEFNLDNIANSDNEFQPIVRTMIDGGLYRLEATNYHEDEYGDIEGYDIEYVRVVDK